MTDNNLNAGKIVGKILCVEIVVDKTAFQTPFDNLGWTLSVYSLENKPAVIPFPEERGITFHFMVYDWKRTIKRLLENQKISYNVTRFFSPDSIFHTADHNVGFSRVDTEQYDVV